MSVKKLQQNMWWGEHWFSPLETKVWRIGARSIAIKRCAQEWTIWNNQESNETNLPIVLNEPTAQDTFVDKNCSRYVLANTQDSLIIEPSLADRAMIVKPGIALNIAPGESIVMYVSTPIWLTILIPGEEVPVADIALWRPSDSWFGPSTMHGDLCYSKYTTARLEIEALEYREHRAITKVHLKNEQDSSMKVERLNIPMPALNMYADPQGRFWTDDVSIVQKQEHGKAVSDLEHTLPEREASLVLVSKSREMSKKASFLSSIRSFVD